MDMRSFPERAGLLSCALLVATAVASPAAAQNADARWLPWLGCWEPVGEGADGSLLCVREAQGGVEVVTLVDGEVAAREMLAADGERHASDQEGCTGWSSARFSSDAHRVYVDSEYRCEGETTRATTGLIAMTSPYEWIEVESIDVGENNVAWVKRYQAASLQAAEAAGFAAATLGRGMAIESARLAASAPIEVGDVIEAAGQVHPEAVEAWIANTNDRLDVDAQSLLAMADADVPESIIDVAVAVSFPEHFALDSQPRDDARYADYYGYMPRGWFGYTSWYDPYYMGGYGYRSPWGYSGRGYGYGYRPTVIVVEPRNQVESGGRAIAGRGYRRGGSGGRPSSIGRDGGSVTRSGGSPASGGRKAKPRKPPPPPDGGV